LNDYGQIDLGAAATERACDAITLEIVRGALRATQSEMEALIERTAMSPFTREKKNFYAALFYGITSDCGLAKVCQRFLPYIGQLFSSAPDVGFINASVAIVTKAPNQSQAAHIPPLTNCHVFGPKPVRTIKPGRD
jgi:hypothetical protein